MSHDGNGAAVRVFIARLSQPAKPHVKNDPAHVAAARELRDRYLEMLNSGQIPMPQCKAKYDVSRALPAPIQSPHPDPLPGYRAREQRQLPEAA